MINDIIKKIVETESQSEQLIKDAFSKAKEIVIDAENTRDKMISDIKSAMREERMSAVERAESQAGKEYDAILDAGKKDALALKKTIATDKLATYIANTYKDRYGNN